MTQATIVFLSRFEETTEDEIHQIIKTYGIKCSPEDPAPVKVLTDNMLTFLPIWTELVNYSLEQGNIDCLKSAVVLPHIKEMDEIMDKDMYKTDMRVFQEIPDFRKFTQ